MGTKKVNLLRWHKKRSTFYPVIYFLAFNAVGNHAADNPFDCSAFTVDGLQFDLTGLRGVHEYTDTRATPPTTTKTTYTVSLCGPLPSGKSDLPEADQCPTGTRVCMTVSNMKSGEPDRIVGVVPIAADFGNGELSVAKELGAQGSDQRRPLVLKMGGGVYNDVTQSVEISFICDQSASDPTDPDLVSYAPGSGLLRLNWKSSHACAQSDQGGQPEEPNNSLPGPPKGWGLISIFFFLLFFGLALYFAIGCWLRYSQYGARGFDMVPNRDFWRDVPYIIRDAFTPSRSARAGYSSLG